MANTRSKDKYPGKDIFRDLSDLLRENGEKILSGQSKLSLTTSCLNILNDNFANISEDDFTTSFEVVPPNTPKLPQYHDLQFLYDIVQKTIALKLIQGSHTLQGRVNLAAFRSLQTLELKKTPLHMLEGINKLRRKLTTLICTRCLRQIQDLIETSGGDMSSPMSWQNLHTASFSYNSIAQLDSSLRLLPALEVLDLSHNYITTTENYLEYLTEIQVVSLGFNQLECVPTFSLSGRQKLQILVLRNNNLDSIFGLEELVSLRELDLANNCLCDHRDLEPIKALHRLNKLFLEGNPVCYHEQHRIKTLENVHPLSIGTLILDGKMVNQQEVMYCRKYHNLTNDSWANISITPDTSRRLPHVSSASSFDFDHSSTSQNEKGALLPKVRTGKGGRRKSSKKGSRRARKAQITDASGDDLLADNSSEASYSSTPHDDSYIEVKQNLETARNQLGPDWLQYLVHNKVSSTERREDLVRNAVLANGSKPEATDDDIFLNAEEPVINSDTADIQPTRIEENTESKGTPRSSKDFVDAQSSQQDKKQELRQRHESHESDTVINWKASSTELEADYGVESEPFIVSHPDDESQLQLIISVTDRYILEKDLNGELLETLDLKCLQSIAMNEEMISTISVEGVHVEMHVIRLTFDYVRKDRRERAYVMEDMDSAKELEELLRPALEANISAVKLRDLMHCLKCGRDFSKSQAEIKVKRIGNQSNSDIYSSNVEKDTLEEVMLCPFCGGSMVIQVESQQQQIAAGGGSNFATPVGSYTMPIQEMPTSPRKHSTPSKLIKEDNTSLASSSFKSIPDSSLASAAFTSMNDTGQTTFGQNSTWYKSVVSNTQNSTDASFDVLDGSKTEGINPSERTLSNRSASNLVGSHLLKGMTALENKSNVESPSRNLFGSGQLQKKRSLTTENAPPRNRQDSTCSTGSDIVVLKQQISQPGSDITLLSNPSQSSISVIEQEPALCELPENNYLLDKNSQPVTFTIAGEALPVGSGSQLQPVMEAATCDADLSPMGSLTNKTLNSMVSSMYEKSLPADNVSTSSQDTPKHKGLHHVSSNESFLSATGESDIVSEKVEVNNQFKSLRPNAGVDQDSSPSIYSTSPALSVGSSSGTEDSSKLYRYDNCNYIDHRLKLHLMMNIFSQDKEEFALILKCGCVQYNKGDEYPCLLVLSSTTIYVLKITGEECASNFEKWLKVVQSHSITNLQYVDIGLGHQSFHAEFVADNSSFTFLIRDERRCKSFLRQFTKLVTSQTASSKSRLEGISKHNSTTLANLESRVLHVDSSEEEIDETILKFSLGYLHTGHIDSKGERSLSPVSVLVTPTHLFLVSEDYNWPLPRSAGSAATHGKNPQFELRDRQRVNDITSIDLYQVVPREMSVHFLDEETNEECSWHIAMETDDALLSLVGTIRQPWETQFGVELQINVAQAEDTS